MAPAHARRGSDSPPNRPPYLPSDRDLETGLKWSLCLHGALIVLLLLKTFVFPGTPVPFVPVLRVDVVGLPDVLKKDLRNSQSSKEISRILKKAAENARKVKAKPLPKAPKPKEIAKRGDLVLHPKRVSSRRAERLEEKKIRESLDRMKALAILSRMQGQAKPMVYKGNHISKGNSISGDAKESNQSNYYDNVLQHLRANWSLPVWLARQNYSAQVQIYIDADGRLHDFRFVKLSGNPRFDQAVKEALQESSPFPAPPRELAATVLVNGIVFGFPL